MEDMSRKIWTYGKMTRSTGREIKTIFIWNKSEIDEILF